ncbi:cohesin complex subunit [Glugoides intestinalis]
MDSLIKNSIIKDSKVSTISALEIFSPEKLIKTLQEKEDCTEELLEIVKTTPMHQLKKLSKIFLNVTNFDIERIVELTVSKTRLQRFNSTFLIFSLIKTNYLNAKMIDQVEALFESVYVPRFRDIDPAIRAMCVQFLCEWTCNSSALRNTAYLKYIGWALNDRNDSVRRKSVRTVQLLAKFSKEKEGSAVIGFIEKYKERLLEIATNDCNQNIQKECCKSVLSIYLKNNALFSLEEILAVLSNSDSCSETKYQVLKKICPEGIWDLDALHRIIAKSNAVIFKNLKLSDSDFSSFVLNIVEFVRNRSTCCNSGLLCFLSILKVLNFTADPLCFVDLLDAVKDSAINTRLVVSALSSVSSYSLFPTSTFKILDYLRKLALTNNYFIEEFVLLLKKIEDLYSLQVETIILDLKPLYPYPTIKYFDISDVVTPDSLQIVKCYAALWMILKEEYSWISSLDFDSPSLLNQPPFAYLEIVDFAIFFHSKMSTVFPHVSPPVDPSTCARLLFEKLIFFISKNFYFDSEESCIRLFKLVSIGYLTDFSKVIFEYCPDEDFLKQSISQVKDIKPLVLGYFEYLEIQKPPKKLYSTELSRLLASKVSKTSTDRYLLIPMKKLLPSRDVLDSVLIHFVPLLNVNECIVLENLAPKSKFKAMLLRKCKSAKDVEENVTFI